MSDKYSDLQPFSRDERLNLFSHWFPKVENCGIAVPKSVVIQVPHNLHEHLYMDHPDEDIDAVRAWVKSSVDPVLEASGLKGHMLFIKNGSFSYKYDACAGCLPPPSPDIAMNIINIMYYDAMFDVGGCSELVIRERITHNSKVTPTIYNGLPFRTEFRVFYDFDTREVIFCANYWDYDYCYSHLHDRTDRIVFDAMREEMQKSYESHKQEAVDLVKTSMRNVDGLTGPWSVDLMLTERGEFYLIDMALAERSAYWEMRPGVDRKEKEE